MANSIKKKQSNFTTVSNYFLRDERISFKAKGLFCYMFSMSEDWNFTMQSIATQQKDGLDSIKSAMNELKEHGYIVYEKHTNGRGTYHLDDEPKVENPHEGNPKLGKSTPIKKEKSTKNKNSKSICESFYEKAKSTQKDLMPYSYFEDFFNYRKEIKKPLKTDRPLYSYNKVLIELVSLGYATNDINSFIQTMKEKEWQTLEVSYVHKENKNKNWSDNYNQPNKEWA